MPRVPWWAVVSSAMAPVLLTGGWTIAAARQPDGYDPQVDTISELGAHGATDRWVMTLTFVGLGICYVVTAAGLRTTGPLARLVLAIGGIATALVAVAPQPASGPSLRHGITAGVASISLALWPAATAVGLSSAPGRVLSALARTDPGLPVAGTSRAETTGSPVRDRRHMAYVWAAIATTVTLLGFLGWFMVELSTDDRTCAGLAERLAAEAEALCPLAFVTAALIRARRRAS